MGKLYSLGIYHNKAVREYERHRADTRPSWETEVRVTDGERQAETRAPGSWRHRGQIWTLRTRSRARNKS